MIMLNKKISLSLSLSTILIPLHYRLQKIYLNEISRRNAKQTAHYWNMIEPMD